MDADMAEDMDEDEYEEQGEGYEDLDAQPQRVERVRLPGPGPGTKLGHVAHRYRAHRELQEPKQPGKNSLVHSDGESDSPANKPY